MKITTRKVAIVGCGLVGSTTAFSLVTQGVCDEVMLIDINKERAYGEMLDMRDSIEYLNRNVKVKTGTYAECGDMDIIVITAGAPPKQGQTRLDTLEMSAKIAKSIVEPIMKSGFDGIFIAISNPVDIIAHYIYKLSGLPKNQVIGTGTAIDSARLQNMIAQTVNVDPRSVHAYSMGEHGDSQMVPWSTVTIAGKPFYDVIADNKELVGDVDLDVWYADREAVPSWAAQAVGNMEAFSVLSAGSFGSKTMEQAVTRADAAQMLSAASTLLAGEEPEGLFGWLQ